MSPLLRRAWRFIRDAKPTHYALLLLGPMFIRPLAFIKQAGEPQPLYARLKGLWGTPFLVAGIFALAVQSLYRWTFWQSSRAAPTQPAADWILQLHQTQSWFSSGGFALALILIYGLAIFSWGYHCGMIALMSKWRPGLIKPPLLYFVVTTAAWGIWLSLFYLLAAYGLWQWDGQGDIGTHMSEYVRSHQTGILLILLVMGAAHMAASRNSGMGRKALYGGSSWICFAVDLISIALLILLALTVSLL